MSGGVDSSVAAFLLREAGFRVEGLFMKNWEEDDGTEYCTARQDLEDATQVCAHLGLPLNQANFAAEYWDNVFEEFLTEYRAGRTPNPDVLCNREIKFNVFARYARVLGADWIATGHYARVDHSGVRPVLHRGVDANKDQSYFLQSVSAGQLENCLFPLGGLEKSRVRAIARSAGIPTFAKKDSTGICFIGERRFADFLKQYLDAAPGPIVSDTGRVIGEHQGLMFHTIGQRQGLGIGGVRGEAEEPWYVIDKLEQTNTLVVGQGNQHPALFSSRLGCETIHWVDGKGPDLPARLMAKIRYRQPDQRVCLACSAEAFEVIFESPQRAVTPGQWVCFYDGDICLGGGVIASRSPS
ncbi:MAG: tRNA 2-thiouridine(34) synthase MnmA [Pseudomonadota bacterium]